MIIPAVITALTFIKTRNGVCCFFFCLVSVWFFVIAALKTSDGRIAVCWGMIPCPACHSPWFQFLWDANLGRKAGEQLPGRDCCQSWLSWGCGTAELSF